MLTNLLKLFQKAFVRLRAATMNPFRRVLRRFQQVFNVNLLTAKLITPINKKIRQILSFKAKSSEDYVTLGRFWISRKLIYFLILVSCAAVFIYFTWYAAPVADSVSTTSILTTTTYDYDDMNLAGFSGKANIRAANKAVVYTGDIDSGICTGAGVLWNQDGAKIYEGLFENNHFSGIGTMYYTTGEKSVMYSGKFENNTFSGPGKLYYPDGTLKYDGEFAAGACSGTGILYDERGNMQYEGEFQNGIYHGSGISYYASGIKKYEGEFYMGKEQGAGMLYSSNGKLLFSGQFARGGIHYESLLGTSLEDATESFNEPPKVYFTNTETCFLYENAGIVLKLDCLVKMRKKISATADGGDYYLPGEDGELLEEEEQETSIEELIEASEQTNSGEGLPGLSSGNRYQTFYYLDTDEWLREADLDLSKIHVTGAAVYAENLDVSFIDAKSLVPQNGATRLLECVAIDRLRLSVPTAFSAISFGQTTKNNSHVQVSGINLAQAIYMETLEKDHVRYKLCYETSDPSNCQFLVLETY